MSHVSAVTTTIVTASTVIDNTNRSLNDHSQSMEAYHRLQQSRLIFVCLPHGENMCPPRSKNILII